MSVRSTRRYPATPEPPPLNNTERLLLAQAVWELGTSWGAVAKRLSKHPLLSRPKSFFTAQFCHSVYDTMIDDAGLERSEANNAIHSPVNLKLAQTNYQLRFAELRALIQDEETKFKTLLSEIEDIRAGLWDVKIQTEQVESHDDEKEQLPQESKDAIQGLPSDEVFGGSDLSGVTDSGSSPSQPQDEIELSPSAELGAAPAPDVEEGTPRLIEPSEEISHLADVSEPFKNDLNEPPAENKQHSPIALHDDQGLIDNEVTKHVDPEATESPLHLQNPQDMENASRTEHVPSDVEVGETTPRPSPEPSPGKEDVPENATHVETGMGTIPQNLIHQEEEEEEEEAKEALANLEEEETDQESETVKNQELESAKQIAPAVEKDREPNRDLVQEPHPIPEISTAEDASQTETGPMEDLLDPDGESVESLEMIESNVAVEESNSSGDEPMHATRRSTRRRKSSAASSAPPLQTRGRLRRQVQITEKEVSPMDMDIDDDGDADEKDRSPQAEDDQRSSPIPADSAIPRRRSGKRKASFVEGVESHRDRKRARDESEPVEEDDPGSHSLSSRPRSTRHGTRTEEQVALKRFQSVISMLHSQISQHRNGNIFHNPIKNSEAPDYHEIVKRPMDLKTIKAKFKDGLIANSLEYQRDIYLMFANAMMYNRPGSDVHTMAEDMMLESDRQIYNFRQTEGLVRGAKR